MCGKRRALARLTVDAILDDAQRLWLLEMNANPAVHPLAYPTMIDALLQPKPRPSTRAPAGVSATMDRERSST